jgi:hypothetical protein
MDIGNIEDYCDQDLRCKDGLIMIATNVTTKEWSLVPLLCSCFWDRYEESLTLNIIASEENKILELHFSKPDVVTTTYELDEMAAFISGFFSGTTKGI